MLTFFLRDISLRKKAEEEQARYAAELERSNRDLEQFAYVASHDLQEPLRKIRTFGDRLELKCQDALDETGRECVERMQNAAARMQSLIDDLLTLSRVTTRLQGLRPRRSGADRPRGRFRPGGADRACGGRVEVGKLPTIQADPLQMRQLLQNLIGNALKFRRPEEAPVVKIEGRYVARHGRREGKGSPAGEMCRITVEDNGIGFDPRHQERIFGIFQRLHPREVYEGTGIGLAICRKIAEHHGGKISAAGQPRQGLDLRGAAAGRAARKGGVSDAEGGRHPHGRRRCRRLPAGARGPGRERPRLRPPRGPRRRGVCWTICTAAAPTPPAGAAPCPTSSCWT